MGMNLIVITEKGVKAVLFRNPGGVSSSASPFAETAGGVALFFEESGDGDFVGPKRSSSVIGPNRGMTRVLAGHEVTP